MLHLYDRFHWSNYSGRSILQMSCTLCCSVLLIHMTHRHMWHDALINVTWLIIWPIDICEILHVCMSHVSVTRHLDTRDMTHCNMLHDPLIYVTRLIHMCEMLHLYDKYHWSCSFTWRMDICDMTHWHDPLIYAHLYVTWLINTTHWYVWNTSCVYVTCLSDTTPGHTWHDSLQYVTRPIDMCEMLHLYDRFHWNCNTPKSTKSRISSFSESRSTYSNGDFGLKIRGFIYPRVYLSGSLCIQNLGVYPPDIWGPNFFTTPIWTWSDGARQLRRGAPRHRSRLLKFIGLFCKRDL